MREWNNVYYYIIAIICFNFVMFYFYSNKKSDNNLNIPKVYNDRTDNMHGINDNNDSLSSSIVLLMLDQTNEVKQKENEIEVNNPSIEKTNSSISEEIGKSISSSHTNLPFPETGMTQIFIQDDNYHNNTTTTSFKSMKIMTLLFYITIALVIVNIRLYYHNKKKQSEEALADYIELEQQKNKYILLSYDDNK